MNKKCFLIATIVATLSARLPAPPVGHWENGLFVVEVGPASLVPTRPSKIREPGNGNGDNPKDPPKPNSNPPAPASVVVNPPSFPDEYPGLHDIDTLVDFKFKDFPSQNPNTTAANVVSGFSLAIDLIQKLQSTRAYGSAMTQLSTIRLGLKPNESAFVHINSRPDGTAIVNRISSLDTTVLTDGIGTNVQMEIKGFDFSLLSTPEKMNREFKAWIDRWSPEQKSWLDDWKNQQKNRPGTNPPPLPNNLPPIPAWTGAYFVPPPSTPPPTPTPPNTNPVFDRGGGGGHRVGGRLDM